MNERKGSAISRREFARRAALASAASIVPAPGGSAAESAATSLSSLTEEQSQLHQEGPAEAEARFQTIVATYAERFNEDQKKELRRLSLAAQPSLDRLRAFAIENGDAPGLYLKPLVEREKKPETKPSASATNPAAKKP